MGLKQYKSNNNARIQTRTLSSQQGSTDPRPQTITQWVVQDSTCSDPLTVQMLEGVESRVGSDHESKIDIPKHGVADEEEGNGLGSIEL